MQPNFNLNRHRSPTERSSHLYFKSFMQGANLSENKNDTYSSNEGSTKEEISFSQRESLVRETKAVVEPKLNFWKNRKEESNINRFEPQHLLKSKNSNSDKGLVIKQERIIESKSNKSPEHLKDYFGFINEQIINKNDKGKYHQKFCDSLDSEKEFKSSHSRSNHERNKFLNQRTSIKKTEGDEVKLFHENQNESKYSQINKQHKEKALTKEYEKRLFFDNLDIKPTIPSFHMTERKLAYKKNGKSPENGIKNGEIEGNNYKRTSLSPLNKINFYKSQVGSDFEKEQLPKARNSHLSMKNKESPSKIIQIQNRKLGHMRSRQRINTIFEKKSLHEYSFSKEVNAKHVEETLYLPRQNNKNIISLSIITITPLTLFPSPSVSFIVLEKLSENNSSEVYKCLHPPTGFIYCLKKCPVSRNNIDQLIIEHKVALYLNHPNLVRSYGSFFDKNNLYLLMEFMEERSLFSQTSLQHKNKVQDQPTINRLSFKERPQICLIEEKQRSNLDSLGNFNIKSIERAKLEKFTYNKQVLEQVLEGLSYLHENCIAHRDLKPDNIFISHVLIILLQNVCKIGDFGSCSFTNSQEYIGTLDYAAPEIMLKYKYDKSIDLWSFGCIAFELDVGRPPFYHSDRNETIRKISQVEYDPELIYEPCIRELVIKLLIKSGQCRPNSNEVLMEVKMMNSGDSFGYGICIGRESGIVSPERK